MNKHFNIDSNDPHSFYVAATHSMEALLSLHRQKCTSITKITNIDINLNSMLIGTDSLFAMTVRLLCLLHIAFQKMTGKDYSIIYTIGINDGKCEVLLPTLLQKKENSTCQSVIEDITLLLEDFDKESIFYKSILANKLISSTPKIIVATEDYCDIPQKLIDENSLLFRIYKREKQFALCLTHHKEVYTNGFIEAVASSISNLEKYAFMDTNTRVNDLCLKQDTTRLSGLQTSVMDIMQKFYDLPNEFEDKIAITQFCQHSNNSFEENNHIKTITFGELRNLSDYFATKIIETSKDMEKTISICVKDRILLIASVLAAIKSGRPFSCIFPLLPDNQKKRIIVNNESELLLCDYYFHCEGSTSIVVSIDGHFALKVFTAPCQPSEVSTNIYTMQTSGTTGIPKRITVKRSGLNNYLSWRVDHYPVSSKDTTLIMLNENSDAFFGSLFPALLAKSRIIIGELEEQRNYEIIANTTDAFNVTTFSATPRMLQALLSSGACDKFQSVKSIIIGGEPSGPELFDLVYEKCPNNIKLIHEYGLTETTITCCANINWNRENANCIGKPIQNTNVYILDKDHKPMPAYLPGMIMVEGTSIASIGKNDDYIGLFNTFDIGYYDKDERIHFIGRHEDDMKINGIRFNHQEVKMALLKQPGVNEVVSYVKDYGNQQQIMAYVTGNDTLDMVHLSEALKEELFLQHIPVTVTQVNSLPTGINEKVETIESCQQLVSNKQITSNSPIKDKIQTYWKQALNIETIDDNKTFFELGGNSILLTKMYKAMQEEQSWDKLRVVDFFKFPTIDSLASHLRTLGYS